MNVGRDNFDCLVYEYFADYTAAFEALKVGNYLFHEEYLLGALGAPATTSRRCTKGWVMRDEIRRRTGRRAPRGSGSTCGATT